ncbi:MAG: hypothetical protein HRT89_25455 [Lentisphaeria bacterium]|nr:hypothetical protein [Lentisphaeria bacterium]
MPGSELRDLKPVDIFSQCYKDSFGELPDSDWMNAFQELLDSSEGSE